MGYNTTMVIMNDCLSEIARDPHFGQKVDAAVSRVVFNKPVSISSFSCSEAAKVIETHHADYMMPVLVGGNRGFHFKEAPDALQSLKDLAESMGYRLVRR